MRKLSIAIVIVSFLLFCAGMFSTAMGYNSASGYHEYWISALILLCCWVLGVISGFIRR